MMGTELRLHRRNGKRRPKDAYADGDDRRLPPSTADLTSGQEHKAPEDKNEDSRDPQPHIAESDGNNPGEDDEAKNHRREPADELP